MLLELLLVISNLEVQCDKRLGWIRMKADDDDDDDEEDDEDDEDDNDNEDALAVAVRDRVWRKVRDRMVRRVLRFMVTFHFSLSHFCVCVCEMCLFVGREIERDLGKKCLRGTNDK